MSFDDPESSHDNEEAIEPAPQLRPVVEDSERAPMEFEEAVDGEDTLAELPVPDTEAGDPEPLELTEPTDPQVPEVMAAVDSDDDDASDAETEKELPRAVPTPTAEEISAPTDELPVEMSGKLEEDDSPVEVEIEFPDGFLFADKGLALDEKLTVDTSPSGSAGSESTSDQTASFITNETPVADLSDDPSVASEDVSPVELSTPSDEPWLSFFAEHDAPLSRSTDFDPQSAADQPIESRSTESVGEQPIATSQSQGDVESFQMPPLLLEVSRTDWEQRMEQLVDRFATQLEKLVEERIEDKFAYRDHVHAAEMRAVYWLG